jgi:rfaE bifunctional protein kinase chain/domain
MPPSLTRLRFAEIARRYRGLRAAVCGDFCLDRYFEIDPALQEVSLETELPVHNIVNVRTQPGGAGTILNNLAALGIGAIYPVSFCGDDGEGYELRRALERLPGVSLEGFFATPERRTFTYTKPLVMEAGRAPRELNRLDIKNWSPTPWSVSDRLVACLQCLEDAIDVLILLEQVDAEGTGVVTAEVLEEAASLARRRPQLLILADSRRGLGRFPPLTFKMNLREFGRYRGLPRAPAIAELPALAAACAREIGRRVFITLAEQGIAGAAPSGEAAHAPALPVRGEIDIVGAGDAVTANLACALAAGAGLAEALEVAMAAASVVIHKLGTTGTASVEEIGALLGGSASGSAG